MLWTHYLNEQERVMTDFDETLSTEASDLGLSPGNFPETLDYDGYTWTRAYVLRRTSTDTTGMVYERINRRGLRVTLVVWND